MSLDIISHFLQLSSGPSGNSRGFVSCPAIDKRRIGEMEAAFVRLSGATPHIRRILDEACFGDVSYDGHVTSIAKTCTVQDPPAPQAKSSWTTPSHSSLSWVAYQPTQPRHPSSSYFSHHHHHSSSSLTATAANRREK